MLLSYDLFNKFLFLRKRLHVRCVPLIATEGKTVLPFVAHTSKRDMFFVQNCYILDL